MINKIIPKNKIAIWRKNSANVSDKVSCNAATSFVILLFNSPTLVFSKNGIGKHIILLYKSLRIFAKTGSFTFAKTNTRMNENNP